MNTFCKINNKNPTITKIKNENDERYIYTNFGNSKIIPNINNNDDYMYIINTILFVFNIKYFFYPYCNNNDNHTYHYFNDDDIPYCFSIINVAVYNNNNYETYLKINNSYLFEYYPKVPEIILFNAINLNYCIILINKKAFHFVKVVSIYDKKEYIILYDINKKIWLKEEYIYLN